MCFVTSNRMLDMKKRLRRAGAREPPFFVLKLGCADEGDSQLRRREMNLLEDEPVLGGREPASLLR